MRVIGIEPVGCPTLEASLAAGRVVALERIETRVATMAARTTARIKLDIATEHVAAIVLVEHDAKLEAARHLWLTSRRRQDSRPCAAAPTGRGRTSGFARSFTALATRASLPPEGPLHRVGDGLLLLLRPGLG